MGIRSGWESIAELIEDGMIEKKLGISSGFMERDLREKGGGRTACRQSPLGAKSITVSYH